jgi:hypothetical protein
MSKIEVNAVEPQSGTTLTLGASGDTVVLAAGATSSGFGETYNGAVNWDTTIRTSGFTAVSGIGYFCNTTGGAFTVTLPASPSFGDVVGIKDAGSYAATNPITIARNGSNIENNASNAFINIHGASTTLVYVDASSGWLVVDSGTVQDFQQAEFVTATGGTVTTCGNCKVHTFTGPGSFVVTSGGNDLGSNSVNYLVVAGGGGGGGGIGGGGGAGGFRESKSPGSNWAASPLASSTSLPISVTTYPITVGAGGIGTGGGGGSNFPGPSVPTQPASTPGSPSIFSTITSTGGGYGRHYASQPTPTQSGPGGSGGGGSGNVAGTGGTGNTPPVSPPQGNTGGNGNPNNPWSAGGGGGATAAGSNWNPSGSGPGGTGATTSISGSSIAYAGGGGGGGSNYGTPAGGTGGTGGGGNGQPGSPPSSGQNGTTNRGGGAGGGAQWSCQQSGYNGGSGIVVIRYKYQ